MGCVLSDCVVPANRHDFSREDNPTGVKDINMVDPPRAMSHNYNDTHRIDSYCTNSYKNARRSLQEYEKKNGKNVERKDIKKDEGVRKDERKDERKDTQRTPAFMGTIISKAVSSPNITAYSATRGKIGK